MILKILKNKILKQQNLILIMDLPIDRCKQEVHDQTLVGKKADSAVFGVSVAGAVRALALERTLF